MLCCVVAARNVVERLGMKTWIPALFVIAVLIAAGIGVLLLSDKDENVASKADLIRVTSPRLNTQVASPMVVQGEARGTWFFEATFPVTLLAEDGTVLTETYATALGDWMTEDFVPFEATVPYSAGTATSGTLVLKKANASGLPEFDDELRVPVRFPD